MRCSINLGVPADKLRTNTQGITMYCAGSECGAWLTHNDQYRGLQYCYTQRPAAPGATMT